MNKHLNAVIFGLAIIISAIFLGKAYVDRKKPQSKIQVTGLGKADFTSDLIVWDGSFSVINMNLKQAYSSLQKNKRIIKGYLIAKGVKQEQMVFSAVSTNNRTKGVYSPNGDYMGTEFVGYELKQSVEINSKDVAKIESISREITELLNQGVSFYSSSPRYYYTKLADLKIEMISKATQDARLRAEKIAEFSGSSLGDLKSAQMGIFQITGQNSNENYSWGGTFNTSSKEKTASITMKLAYELD